MPRTHAHALIGLLAAAALGGTALAGPVTTVVGFDGGDPSGFTGNAFFEAAGGNPDGNAHHLGQFFGTSLRTGGVGEPSNPDFLGDYSGFGSVTFGFDIRVDALTDFIGNPITRSIGIALRDRDIQGPSGPSGLFFELSLISSSLQDDWTHLEVTIDDPTQTDLPAGWIGFGDEDPNTFEPILPAGASFATVLAGVDEFEITTFVPGFFYADAGHDVRIDNVSVVVPAPASGCVLLAFGIFGRRRRRS